MTNTMHPFERFLLDVAPLPDEDVRYLMDALVTQDLPKNSILLRSGKVCDHLWFLESGLVRHYYTDQQGRDTNVWFSREGEMVTEVPSFCHRLPSQETLQLLEDGVLHALTYDQVYGLLAKSHAFALWYIRLIEVGYVSQIEERTADLQFLNAPQRYAKLIERFPDILQRTSLGHIASFLNITQETLSRIRSGKL